MRSEKRRWGALEREPPLRRRSAKTLICVDRGEMDLGIIFFFLFFFCFFLNAIQHPAVEAQTRGPSLYADSPPSDQGNRDGRGAFFPFFFIKYGRQQGGFHQSRSNKGVDGFFPH